VATFGAFACTALGALNEPLPDSSCRDLRTDYVANWYIYNDNITDGILNPGDTLIDSFQNWWTPVSAHSQHNYTPGPYGAGPGFMYDDWEDRPSGPMNYASSTAATDNYWLPMNENEVHFYVTYSQYDNNDFSTFYNWMPPGDQKDMLIMRNEERNGYALGWVSNCIVKDSSGDYQHCIGPGGQVAMDIYVHNGDMDLSVDFGSDGVAMSRSNPQVSVSNDISWHAKEGATYQPPTFTESTQTYDSAANAPYKNALGLTDGEFGTVVNSMEVREVDPGALTAADVIYGDKTPAEIAANEVDHNGDPYVYEDAFLDRCQYDLSTSDGGVVAGLSGYVGENTYDEWGDQQVIRIDLPQSMLNDVEAVVFYDFGDSTPGASGTQQTAPAAIRFDIEGGLLVYKANPQDPSTWIYFPENRIYIARTFIRIPEPATLSLLAIGAALPLLRRRRRR
jgi:hypothetical protein